MNASKVEEQAIAALASMSMRKLRACEYFWKSDEANALRIEGRPALFWVVEQARDAMRCRQSKHRLAALTILSWLGGRMRVVDCVHEGTTPLMEASAWGDLAAVRRLVRAGASLDKTSPTGNTPLHWAAIGGRPAVCRFLVSEGAKLEVVNHNRQTPLHCAADRLRMNTIAALHEAGSSWKPKDVHGRTPIETLLHRDAALARLWINRPEKDHLAGVTRGVVHATSSARSRRL